MKRRNHTWLFGESPCGPPRTPTPPRTPKDPGGLISRPPHRDDHAEHEHRWRDNELISATPPSRGNQEESDVSHTSTIVKHIPFAVGKTCSVRGVSGRGGSGRTSQCEAVVTVASNSARETVMTYIERNGNSMHVTVFRPRPTLATPVDVTDVCERIRVSERLNPRQRLPSPPWESRDMAPAASCAVPCAAGHRCMGVHSSRWIPWWHMRASATSLQEAHSPHTEPGIFQPSGGSSPPVWFFSRSEQGEWGVPTTPRNSRKKQRHPSTCTCNVQL